MAFSGDLAAERRAYVTHRRCRHRPRNTVILISLLMVGPCCALFSTLRVSTVRAGGIAVGLALLLAIPDGIWGTTAQLALTGAVLMVAIACTWGAGIIEAAVGP